MSKLTHAQKRRAKIAKLLKFEGFKKGPEELFTRDLGRSLHGFKCKVYLNTRGGVRIDAGCRLFEIPQALKHWNPRTYHRLIPGEDKYNKVMRAIAKNMQDKVILGYEMAAKHMKSRSSK